MQRKLVVRAEIGHHVGAGRVGDDGKKQIWAAALPARGDLLGKIGSVRPENGEHDADEG